MFNNTNEAAMKTFLPLTAAALFAACTGSMLMSVPAADSAVAQAETAVDARVYDLGTVTVSADSSNRYAPAAQPLLADLGTLTVHPKYNEFQPTARLVDLGTVVVRASESLASADAAMIATALVR
jgi:hypothetical protein